MAAITVILAGKKLGTYTMKHTPWVVGREASCGVPIENVGVSRRHCQFTCENGRYFVEDLGSSNGTFCQGRKITKVPIEDGAEISAGKYVLFFEEKGMELLPTPVGSPGPRGAIARPGAGAASSGQRRGPDRAAAGLGGAMRTFQVDAQTLREQMAKAGVAAAPTVEAQRAADVVRSYNPDASLELKAEKQVGRYFISAVKILGLAMLATAVLIVLHLLQVF